MKFPPELSMHGSGMWPKMIKLKMLHAKLMKAVPSMIGASILISSRKNILVVASHESQTTMPQIIMIETKAPSTSALWYPKEFFAVAFFYPIYIEIIDIPIPPTSESMCAASVKIANELEMIPPAISTIMKRKQIATTIPSFLKASFPLANYAWKSSS